MKKLLIYASVLAATVSCNIKKDGSIAVFNTAVKEGKGPLKSIDVNMSIDEISVSQSIQAEVIRSEQEKVVLTAPSDIIDEIVVTNANGKLSIHFKENSNVSAKRVSAKIYVKDFSKISADSSADIKVRDNFTLAKLDLQADSSGSVTGNFKADEVNIHTDSSGDFSGQVSAGKLRASADSSGDIVVSGSVQNADFHADSSGGIHAKNLLVENAKLHADSSGSISVSVTKSLEADADSAGSIDVYRKGNVQVIRQNSDSGGSVSLK